MTGVSGPGSKFPDHSQYTDRLKAAAKRDGDDTTLTKEELQAEKDRASKELPKGQDTDQYLDFLKDSEARIGGSIKISNIKIFFGRMILMHAALDQDVIDTIVKASHGKTAQEIMKELDAMELSGQDKEKILQNIIEARKDDGSEHLHMKDTDGVNYLQFSFEKDMQADNRKEMLYELTELYYKGDAESMKKFAQLKKEAVEKGFFSAEEFDVLEQEARTAVDEFRTAIEGNQGAIDQFGLVKENIGETIHAVNLLAKEYNALEDGAVLFKKICHSVSMPITTSKEDVWNKFLVYAITSGVGEGTGGLAEKVSETHEQLVVEEAAVLVGEYLGDGKSRQENVPKIIIAERILKELRSRYTPPEKFPGMHSDEFKKLFKQYLIEQLRTCGIQVPVDIQNNDLAALINKEDNKDRLIKAGLYFLLSGARMDATLKLPGEDQLFSSLDQLIMMGQLMQDAQTMAKDSKLYKYDIFEANNVDKATVKVISDVLKQTTEAKTRELDKKFAELNTKVKDKPQASDDAEFKKIEEKMKKIKEKQAKVEETVGNSDVENIAARSEIDQEADELDKELDAYYAKVKAGDTAGATKNATNILKVGKKLHDIENDPTKKISDKDREKIKKYKSRIRKLIEKETRAGRLFLWDLGLMGQVFGASFVASMQAIEPSVVLASEHVQGNAQFDPETRLAAACKKIIEDSLVNAERAKEAKDIKDQKAILAEARRFEKMLLNMVQKRKLEWKEKDLKKIEKKVAELAEQACVAFELPLSAVADTEKVIHMMITAENNPGWKIPG